MGNELMKLTKPDPYSSILRFLGRLSMDDSDQSEYGTLSRHIDFHSLYDPGIQFGYQACEWIEC